MMGKKDVSITISKEETKLQELCNSNGSKWSRLSQYTPPNFLSPMILTHSNNLDKSFSKDGHTSFAASMVLQINVEPKTYSIAVCRKNRKWKGNSTEETGDLDSDKGRLKNWHK
jgi:hypothetical protein